jgi:polar amino acid transport system permease protein
MTALNPHPAKAKVNPQATPRRLSQFLGFRTRLYLTWAGLFGL